MDTETLLLLAQNAVDIGNIKAACEFYEIALQQSPKNDEVLAAYAEILIHYVGDTARAEQMLRHAISINPHEGYIKYLNLAQLSAPEESLQSYRAAYNIAERMMGRARSKNDRKALKESMATMCCAVAELYLTDLCFAEDAESNCEMAVNQALSLCQDSVEAHQLQASLRVSQSRPEDALAALRRAVDLTHHLSEEHQPTYESKIELARLLMQVSPDDAFPYLLELLQISDGNPYVWFLLGECARLRKRYPDAARLLRRARVMVMVSSSPDEVETAVREVDESIAVLVEEMGGPEAVNQICDLDCPNPLELLEDEPCELAREEEDGEGEALDEPTWEMND